jgi:hypothetical protein
MEPLSTQVRQAVLRGYLESAGAGIEMNEHQKNKILSSLCSAQPIYLRMLLHALHLGQEVSDMSLDVQLELLLRCNTAFELVSTHLDMCNQYLKSVRGDDTLMAHVLTAIYTSRKGLYPEEIWGIVELVSGTDTSDECKAMIMRTLKVSAC